MDDQGGSCLPARTRALARQRAREAALAQGLPAMVEDAGVYGVVAWLLTEDRIRRRGVPDVPRWLPRAKDGFRPGRLYVWVDVEGQIESGFVGMTPIPSRRTVQRLLDVCEVIRTDAHLRGRQTQALLLREDGYVDFLVPPQPADQLRPLRDLITRARRELRRAAPSRRK